MTAVLPGCLGLSNSHFHAMAAVALVMAVTAADGERALEVSISNSAAAMTALVRRHRGRRDLTGHGRRDFNQRQVAAEQASLSCAQTVRDCRVPIFRPHLLRRVGTLALGTEQQLKSLSKGLFPARDADQPLDVRTGAAVACADRHCYLLASFAAPGTPHCDPSEHKKASSAGERGRLINSN